MTQRSSPTFPCSVIPVATTLPGTWHNRVNARTAWPSVNRLSLGEIANLDLQLVFQCGSMRNYLVRSVPEILWHVAGTLRRPPRERKFQDLNSACSRIFPGRVIPVT